MPDGSTAGDFAAIMAELDRRDAQRRFDRMFPDETHTWRGEEFIARRLYKKHLAFFRAGAIYPERAFIAANRVGKTEVGAYETAAHLTGRYPHWWEGRRFDRPIEAWAAGKTNETARDIVMKALMGEATGAKGSKHVAGRMIRADDISGITWRNGFADLVESCKIRHVSGGYSLLGIKSYEQGRGSFEGTAKDLAWPDEEPPADVASEIRTRLMTRNGLFMLTFTPLEGHSDVVDGFLRDDVAGEDDLPPTMEAA